MRKKLPLFQVLIVFIFLIVMALIIWGRMNGYVLNGEETHKGMINSMVKKIK